MANHHPPVFRNGTPILAVCRDKPQQFGDVRTDEIHPKHELVGTHTGRRTFIVNALSRGIAPNVVMKWTGHSDYKAMKPYIDIVDSIRAREMTKMDFMD